jgi:DNA processing protein
MLDPAPDREDDDPQAEDSDLIDALRLHLVPGIGPRLQQSLEAAFGSAAAILQASHAELLQVEGIGPKLAKAIIEHRGDEAAIREIDRCRQSDIRLYRRGGAAYPRMLAEICDPPRILYCRGRLEPRDELAVAIVGSRRCSVYGRQQTERFASALARAGVTIISGLARGIDAAAHRGALEAGGRTIAVAATGLAQVYPPEHKELAAEIAEHGAVVLRVVSRSGTDRRVVSPAQPDHQRAFARRDHHRGDKDQRGAAHGPSCARAGTRGLCAAGTN